MNKTILSLACITLSSLASFYSFAEESEWVTIKNGHAWIDDQGKMVQAHGAGFIKVDDTWYMVGEDRGNTWRPDVNMYSSKDLQTWKFERKIIQNGVTHSSLGSSRMIERPKIAYCPSTGQYVVWCHWESSNYSTSQAACFYSDVINGPYTYHWAGRPMNIKSRDCTLFVDDDGTAYFISTTSENTNLGLFRLSDDYLEVVEHTELFKGDKREAPAIARVGDTYYMLSSACSGWAPNQCKLSTSTDLKEGWTPLENVGNNMTYDTQAASILTIKGTEKTTYLYVGDRWQDPNLPESKTIIFPIDLADGSCKMYYRDRFDINFTTGEWRETPTEGTRLDKSGWSILSYSSTANENYSPEYIFDGDYNTLWQSGSSSKQYQHIAVDFGDEYDISGFVAAHNVNGPGYGTVKEYVLQTSLDGENWTVASANSWGPYWAEIYFPQVKARYAKLTIPTLNSNIFISELDFLTKPKEYEQAAISPRYKIGNSQWIEGQDIEVEVGESITFGPNSGSVSGNWATLCPDGKISLDRQFTVSDITSAAAGVYEVCLLDHYGNSHLTQYRVTVKGDGIETIIDDQKESAPEYYSLDGRKITEPHGITLVRQGNSANLIMK